MNQISLTHLEKSPFGIHRCRGEVCGLGTMSEASLRLSPYYGAPKCYVPEGTEHQNYQVKCAMYPGGKAFIYFLKLINKEKQRSTEYTSKRVINPS